MLQRVKERVDFKDHIIIAGDLADADVLLAALRTRVLHAMGMAKQVRLAACHVDVLTPNTHAHMCAFMTSGGAHSPRRPGRANLCPDVP